ncbi:MAG: SMC-Scp complex subunit ScpB [candidate division Zixibacteria bacterium]
MIKDENINCTIEALILASPEPVSARKLCDVIGDITPPRIRQAVGDLNNVYMGCGSSFRIREVANGYQFHILPDFEGLIKKLLTKERTVRLTRAALEALAIIAYKQPVTKTEIEHIRGVASDGVLHNLLNHKLILIAGRAETPGRPLLYKTSSEFLKFFGLNRISDLPRMDEIEEMIKLAEEPKEQTALPFEEIKEQEAFEINDKDSDESAIMETNEDEIPEGVSIAVDDFAGDQNVESVESRIEHIDSKPEEIVELPREVSETNMFSTELKIDSLDAEDKSVSDKDETSPEPVDRFELPEDSQDTREDGEEEPNEKAAIISPDSGPRSIIIENPDDADNPAPVYFNERETADNESDDAEYNQDS